jgi:hypothetical protein
MTTAALQHVPRTHPETGVLEREPIQDDARKAAGRHRALALRALTCGHGVQWAADITGLPLRLVARVAAAYRIPAARPMPDVPDPSLWESLVLRPGRLPRRGSIL